MAQPAVPREAATLVLLRDRRPGPGPLEVLMLKRHAADAFAANAYVFPGGMLEEADWGPRAPALSPRLSGDQALARMPDAAPPAKALGFAVCAIRETFEEAGLLLARDRGDTRWALELAAPRQVAEARAALHEGRLGFLEWLARQGWVLATERLLYFAHWITPAASPIRFDARFFAAEAPEAGEAASDQREVVHQQWFTPAEALAHHGEGRMKLVNATVRTLEWLGRFETAAAALAGLAGREIRPILPRAVVRPDGSRVTINPWEPGYDRG
ncbi:MAG: NUDIX hydrolase [Candidatus Lambdaproteobacteria bacterium]|nr:NUDIX hydrolase [Candidatus Lambdaproteobacteria bacterium]